MIIVSVKVSLNGVIFIQSNNQDNKRSNTMLIHLTPTFFNPYQNVKVTLEQLSIIVEKDNFEYEIPITELSLKKPYRNKNFYVACGKRKNKAFVGLLAHIEEDQINKFTVYEKWKTIVNDDENDHFHYITFNLLDNKFNAVSQDFTLWRAYGTDIHQDWIPVNCTPKMEFDTAIFENSPRRNEIEDGYYFNGIIKQRNEQYFVPTIPFAELFKQGEALYSNRMPDINLDGFNLTRD